MSPFSIGRKRAGGGKGGGGGGGGGRGFDRTHCARAKQLLPVLRGIVDQTIVFLTVCFNMKQYRSTFICIAWVIVVYIVHPFSISAQYI